MDGVGYLAAREPLFPLFPALSSLAPGIKKREEKTRKGEVTARSGGLDAEAASRRW